MHTTQQSAPHTSGQGCVLVNARAEAGGMYQSSSSALTALKTGPATELDTRHLGLSWPESSWNPASSSVLGAQAATPWPFTRI